MVVSGITDKQYWEDYYGNNSANREVITAICSPYDKYWDKLIVSCANKPKSIIEIGGYPGRYLAYISSKYKLKPYCLDFNSDTSKIQQSFNAMNVTDYEMIQHDFEKYKTEKKFDILFSHGFIEHFNNYNEILDKHALLVADGGSMMITVPNKRGLRYWYGLLLDKKNLDGHNTACMKKRIFLKFVERNNLELVEFSYFGGFPYAVHQKLNGVQKVLYGVLRRFFKVVNPFLSKHPNRYTCSLLVCIARKPLSQTSQ